jgi:DNA replication ATP-dependent helicase Dna2
VTPHRAQQGLIVRRLRSAFSAEEAPPERVRAAVDTVERFQGQQRDVMVASFALGDPDLVGDEEEFLLGMERFNVMVSRARAKAIVLVSEAVVRHLAEDVAVLRGSQLLKGFVEGWCDASEPLCLARQEGDATVPVPGVLRWHRTG